MRGHERENLREVSDEESEDEVQWSGSAQSLRYTREESTLNLQMEATMTAAHEATQRLQGLNVITTDQIWPTLVGLHRHYDNKNAPVIVPKTTQWPLEGSRTSVVKEASKLKPPIVLQRRIMASELKDRFIDKGPSRCLLMAMKLNPTMLHNRILNHAQLIEMEELYRREYSAMEQHAGLRNCSARPAEGDSSPGETPLAPSDFDFFSIDGLYADSTVRSTEDDESEVSLFANLPVELLVIMYFALFQNKIHMKLVNETVHY